MLKGTWKKIFSRPKKHFGIDIGSGSIKLVEIESGKEKPVLKILSSAPLPQDIYRKAEVGPGRDLSEAIRELVAKSGISTPYCVSAIEGQKVFNRFATFPLMSKAEILEAVKWDAEKYMLPSPEDYYLDAVILEKEPGAREMKVLLVAAGKEMINRHVDTLRKADLVPIGIDFGALALGRVLPDRFVQQTTVIFDVGGGSTKMTVYKGRAMAFSRTIPFGGNMITRILRDQLSLSWTEAEFYKLRQREWLIPREGEKTEAERVRNMVRLAVHDAKREINRSLAYYRRQNQGKGPSRIIFTGGGSLLPGLKEILADDLHLPHASIDLSEVVDFRPHFDKTYLQSVSPAFGIALGLARWEERA